MDEFSSCNKTTNLPRSACLLLTRIKNVLAVFSTGFFTCCHVTRCVVMSKCHGLLVIFTVIFDTVFRLHSSRGSPFVPN